MSDDVIVTNPSDVKALQDMLTEMTHSMRKMDDEREHIGEIAKLAEEKFGIKKKIIRKIASTMYKHNYADVQAENEHFEHLYETLVEGRKVKADAA